MRFEMLIQCNSHLADTCNARCGSGRGEPSLPSQHQLEMCLRRPKSIGLPLSWIWKGGRGLCLGKDQVNDTIFLGRGNPLRFFFGTLSLSKFIAVLALFEFKI